MSTYTPTIEDIAYLADTQPEKFTNVVQTKSSIENAIGYGQDGVGLVLQEDAVRTHYGDYMKNGGEELTQSPIPLESADVDGDGIMDPEFASACKECQSGEPCCLERLTIKDKSEPSRMIYCLANKGARVGPHLSSSASKHLLVVADKVDSSDIYGEVSVTQNGRKCQIGHAGRAAIRVKGSLDTKKTHEDHTESSFDEKIGANLPGLTSSLSAIFPDEVSKYLMAFDLGVNAGAIAAMIKKPALFTDYQCFSGPAAFDLSVTALPQLDILGKGAATASLRITTAGISADASLTGTLKGTFGPYQLEATAVKPTEKHQVGSIAEKPAQPGILGAVLNIVGRMDEAALKTGGKQPLARKQGPEDLAKLVPEMYATGITLTPSLNLKCSKIKLKAKAGSPNLELDVKAVETSLSLVIIGQINLLEMLANAFGGFGSAVTEAQAKMASGKAVTVDIQTTLKLSSHGAVMTGLDLEHPIEIKPDGSIDNKGMDTIGYISGKIRIIGSGQLSAFIDGEFWVFEVHVGVGGIMAAAWTWEFDKRNGKKQRRYYFEGVYASAFFEASVDGSKKNETKTDRGKTSISASQELIDMNLGDMLDLSMDSPKLSDQAKNSEHVKEVWAPTPESESVWKDV